MTRETKIGLLVGLAFLLVVGILLSEQVVHATQPAAAKLADAGSAVRKAAETPRPLVPAVAPARAQPNTGPATPVPTREQLDAQAQFEKAQAQSAAAQAKINIEIGSPGSTVKELLVGPAKPLSPRDAALSTSASSALAGTAVANASVTPTPTNPDRADSSTAFAGLTEASPASRTANPTPTPPTRPAVPASLIEAARAAGEELIDTKSAAQAAAAEMASTPAATIPNSAKVREYLAVPGDSLSKIAKAQLGSNSQANRDAIIALNPSLQKDADRVIEGSKYLLPADAWTESLGQAATTKKPAAIIPQALPDRPAETQTASTDKQNQKQTEPRLYTVKAGDSLWKIAERELGGVSQLETLRTLNAETLGDSDQVRVGMKLKLPAPHELAKTE